MTKPEMIGQKFGRLTVIADAESIRNKRGKLERRVLARCDCGNEKVVRPIYLRTGNTGSCGCIHRELASKRMRTHGACVGARSTEYTIWDGLKNRCLNPNNHAYRRYGGRGITVCDRWLHGDGVKTGYECFLADMGPRPEGKSIDRFPNYDGPYSPENSRWATRKEQSRNQEKNIIVTIHGTAMSLPEACEKYGVPRSTAWGRIYRGIDPEQAVIGGPFR